MGRLAAILLALLLTAPDKPYLELRVFPKLALVSGMSCANFRLTAEIHGPEVAGWYCPKVTWIFPDDTRASEESDCDPFEERAEFPRRWSRSLCAPEGEWTIAVELSKSGKVIARQSVVLTAR